MSKNDKSARKIQSANIHLIYTRLLKNKHDNFIIIRCESAVHFISQFRFIRAFL